MEREHGWAVTGVQGTQLSMTYKREIELVFDAASFRPESKQNSRIDLWYIGNTNKHDAAPTATSSESESESTAREFFLQCLRDHVRALPQSGTTVPALLARVGASWQRATAVMAQARRLNVAFPTRVSRTADDGVEVRATLLLRPVETKVEIVLALRAGRDEGGLTVAMAPSARVVYGEHFNVAKIAEFLTVRMGEFVGGPGEAWDDVVGELYQRLLARGRKAAN